MAQSKTFIHVVLDRSGSMDSCIDDTIGGFNSFVKSQREPAKDLPQGATQPEKFLSLHLFDHEFETLYVDKPVADVELLNHQTFVPRGNTALLDAIGRTIITVSEKPEAKDDNNSFVIVILTDGQENASHEYNQGRIRKMIKEYDAKPNWSFVFLAANQDAITSAEHVGMSPQSAMNFSSQAAGKVQQCFANLSAAITRQTMTPMHSKVMFTQEEQHNATE